MYATNLFIGFEPISSYQYQSSHWNCFARGLLQFELSTLLSNNNENSPPPPSPSKSAIRYQIRKEKSFSSCFTSFPLCLPFKHTDCCHRNSWFIEIIIVSIITEMYTEFSIKNSQGKLCFLFFICQKNEQFNIMIMNKQSTTFSIK